MSMSFASVRESFPSLSVTPRQVLAGVAACAVAAIAAFCAWWAISFIVWLLAIVLAALATLAASFAAGRYAYDFIIGRCAPDAEVSVSAPAAA